MQETNCSKQRLSETIYSGHFYGPLSMSVIISNCSRYLSNTAESEKTINLIDDPDRDVTYRCLREYFFSLGNAIN